MKQATEQSVSNEIMPVDTIEECPKLNKNVQEFLDTREQKALG